MASPQLEQPHSWRDRALFAQNNGVPLVIMTTLKGCPFCDVVRTNYLSPMHQRTELIALQLDITDGVPVEYFDGQWLTPREISRLWKNRVAPTLYFFNAQGREVAERLEGMAVPDFFGVYLDQRLALAREAMRPSATSRNKTTGTRP